jgi:hypothetical protein
MEFYQRAAQRRLEQALNVQQQGVGHSATDRWCWSRTPASSIVATALSAGIRQRKESTSRGVLMWAASVQAAVERRSDGSVVQRIFDVEAM